ncbi:MAG: hypothetical protein JXA52_08435, partial [Planctomycetes bacterium]|nr:hypothetical protein [Planctomycetota bacterium]
MGTEDSTAIKPLDNQALPKWYSALGWIALLGTVLFSLLPNSESLFNITSGLGVIALIIYLSRYRRPDTVPKPLFIIFIIFFMVAILTAIIPHYAALPDFEPMSDSLHDLWNLVQAIVVASLCLVMLRKRDDLISFLMLFTLIILLITIFSPILGFMKNGLGMRLTGTKGGANRYAIMLMVSSLPIWILVLSKDFKSLSLRAWGWNVGRIVVILTIILIFYKLFLKAYHGEVHSDTGFVLWTLIMVGILIPNTLWFSAKKQPVFYRIISRLAPIGIYINLYLSASRMALALALLILFCVVLWKLRKHWLRCLLITGILIGAIGG